MSFKKVNDKLNKNVNEETELINSLSIGKYLLIYIPILFLMFAIGQVVANLLFNFEFDWRSVLIQAICFALFFRVFHKIRKYTQQNWKNKHN
jgi:membrane protein required for beta-lactamase induction